ncbi:hypothetical protein ACFFYR_27840 [Paraburkholderia dipogonis]
MGVQGYLIALSAGTFLEQDRVPTVASAWRNAMQIVRYFILAALALFLFNPNPCWAQTDKSATDAAASQAAGSTPEAASVPTVVVSRAYLMSVLNASDVKGAPSDVTLPRDQLMRLQGSATGVEQSRLIKELIYWSFLFVTVGLVIILIVAALVRTAFWRHAAELGPQKWRDHLLQLPLGAPEGSIRALLSLFVVTFGIIALALQKYLDISSPEALTSFVTAVITFYFTSRASEQARKAALISQETLSDTVDKNNVALQQANKTAVDAQQNAVDKLHDVSKEVLKNSADATNTALETVSRSYDQAAAANLTGDSGDVVATLTSKRDQLQNIQQIARAVDGLGLGTDILPRVADTVSSIQGLLDTINPLLTSKPDAATVTKVLGDVSTKLPALAATGLPGVLAEATAVLGDVAGLVLAGLPAGPVGIVGGILVSAIRLASDAPKMAQFKGALLGQPFDPVLLPSTTDPSVAQAALESAPLMLEHFANADDPARMKLMGLAIRKKPDGTLYTSDELAALCATEVGNGTSAELPPRSTESISNEELTQAFDQYRGALVHLGALAQLAGSVAISLPDDPGKPVSIDFKSIVNAAIQASANPKAAAQIEKLVFLGEALSKAHLDPAKTTQLVFDALSLAAKDGLVQDKETVE